MSPPPQLPSPPVNTIVPVVLSGGAGTRLWPLSRRRIPKQLHRLLGEGTMIQDTVRRLDGLAGLARPIIVCSAPHYETIRSQLRAIDVDPELMIVEPEGRNTAPAVAAAALAVDGDPTLLVLPSDHLISDVEAFHAAVDAAAGQAVQGSLVTFGVSPARPEAGFGYIELGPAHGPGYEVARFVEKPDVEAARSMIETGGHLWNSGMFVFGASSILSELGAHAPGLVEAVTEAMVDQVDGVVRLGARFVDAPSVSLDVAVMEKTTKAVVVELEAGWSDLGSWAALWEVSEKNAAGNVLRGDAVVLEVADSFIAATSRTVAVAGVDRIVVVETPDAVLVVPLDRSELVKEIISSLDPEMT